MNLSLITLNGVYIDKDVFEVDAPTTAGPIAINEGHTPLAMSSLMMVVVIGLAVSESGPIKHFKHYFPGTILNPMNLFLGLIELMSEFTRLASLALRLFLNVVIGEILIAIFAYLGGAFGPATALPFTLLEILVGVLQAYIFVVLCISYLSVATAHNHDHEDHSRSEPEKEVSPA